MKKRIIIICITVILLVIVSILYFQSKKEVVKVNEDAIKFSSEYTEVGIDNVYKYKTIDEAIKILDKGTGIIFFGFPECAWCQRYAVYLNEAAKETDIDTVYYVNIYEERKNNTENYQKIVEKLGNNLQYDDEGNLRLFVPNLTMVKKGEVIFNDCETSLDTGGKETPDQYWNFIKVNALKDRLEENMLLVKEAITTCTDCNK